MTSAYLLVSHGSRDPRPQQEVDQLAQLLCQKLENYQSQLLGVTKVGTLPVAHPGAIAIATAYQPLVATACLELAPEPLHRQIENFGKKALAAGLNRLKVLPLFLLPGVHVMEDIPGEVAIAQQTFGEELTIEIRPHLGTHPGMRELFAKQMADFDGDAWILLSHGSRREGGNQPVEALAAHLGAFPAFWSVHPKLEFQVKALLMAGYRQIGILPYFLFGGGITDAIARSVMEISQEFPAVNFYLAKPLGASVELTDLILDLAK